jgi:FPC/CPF motif-containing protein YcgG
MGPGAHYEARGAAGRPHATDVDGGGDRAAGRADWLAPDCAPPSAPLAELIHDQFRALVLHPGFSCLGAKAALRGGGYRMGIYEAMGSPRATEGLARDLSAFVRTLDARTDGQGERGGLTTFVASFLDPIPGGEAGFERRLWAQLQALHDRDAVGAWDPSVSADPEDPHFSFSVAGRAFFVVGLHAASTRWARRFAWPTLVFNPHAQFERLRAHGHFGRLQALIRARERALQGSLNPNLGDFGERSEARQYSGRPVDAAWRCPFRPKGVGQAIARPVDPSRPDEDRP